MNTIKDDFAAILGEIPKPRSAWGRGVRATARDLLETVENLPTSTLPEKALLNGAANWEEWARGGCGLIYDTDIAERYCSPSELKRVHGGERPPNANEDWLGVEARAAFQSSRLILRAIYRLNKQEASSHDYKTLQNTLYR